MSSSDSEDDCYGSVVKKLNILKSQFNEDKVDTLSLLELPKSAQHAHSLRPVEPPGPANPHEDPEDPEDTSELDAMLAQSANVPKAKVKKTALTKFTFKSLNDIPVTLPPTNTQIDVEGSSSNTRPKRVTRSSSRRGRKTLPCQLPDQSTLQPPNLSTLLPDLPMLQPPEQPTRAARGRKNTPANNTQSPQNNSRSANCTLQNRSRGRGTRAGRARSRRGWFVCGRPNPLNMAMALQQMMPTYSVGNTSEYPDALENQQLFSSATQQQDIIVVEDEANESLEEYNEELSVKVYWQSWEYFKFTIRRYQKLKQIFDYFADKEKVDRSFLLFTYNDKILKQDDTPDSISYSIAKFIDGGVVKESLSFDTKVGRTAGNTGGITIKFQFQNVKKPFETTVDPNEKLGIAMAKCSEHLEKQLKDLKFFFDGERINRDSTPQDLEFEGGECIDVKNANT